MRWREAETLQFVKLYLKHECLWNPAHHSYKITFQREKAYERIVTEFKDSTGKQLTIPEVKQKIKNLRTTYSYTVQKILRKSSPESIYEPSLVWFNEMDECLKNLPSNRHISYYNPETYEEIDESIWNSSQLDMEGITSDPLTQPLRGEIYDSFDNKQYKSPNKHKSHRKKRKSHTKEYVIDETPVHLLRQDEFDIYGRYIASQLRKMDLQKALKIQVEIQNLICGARSIDD